jgi:hypothetical protein
LASAETIGDYETAGWVGKAVCGSGGFKRCLMGFCGGSTEVVLAAVGFEKRTNGEVAIECRERTGLSIETADSSSGLVGLQDPIGERCVAQILGHREVLL